MKILVAGDVHANSEHLLYLGQQALDQEAKAILIVGDFGYWEHMHGGPEFLDVCSEVATANDLPIYWIDGNHENHTMLRALYGPGGARHHLTKEGFWGIRDGLYYIPRGTRWNWNGVEMMGLGGAYSIDKPYRLEKEREEKQAVQRYLHNKWSLEGQLLELATAFSRWKHTRWWPEEEISQAELDYALSDDRPLDILFTHDKPRSSNPQWNRKDFPECFPNQDKIQEVVRKLHPALLIHGHLHYRYDDQIRASDNSYTKVVGLANDVSKDDTHNPRSSWVVLELEK